MLKMKKKRKSLKKTLVFVQKPLTHLRFATDQGGSIPRQLLSILDNGNPTQAFGKNAPQNVLAQMRHKNKIYTKPRHHKTPPHCATAPNKDMHTYT